MQHSTHLNTGFDFMLRYDEVQTEKKKQAMLPFPTPSRHHLFISPFFSVFLFLPFHRVFAALLADGPTDVTVSCLDRLSRFGQEQRHPQEKEKKNRLSLNLL